MNKTIKSNTRQLLFTMIGKYKEKRDEREEISDTKAAFLRTISDFLG